MTIGILLIGMQLWLAFNREVIVSSTKLKNTTYISRFYTCLSLLKSIVLIGSIYISLNNAQWCLIIYEQNHLVEPNPIPFEFYYCLWRIVCHDLFYLQQK